jgi:hypothetical protein
MAILASATGVPFTPVVGLFSVVSKGGPATLLRRGASGAPQAIAGVIEPETALDVNNAVAGQVWEFAAAPGVTVRADGTPA